MTRRNWRRCEHGPSLGLVNRTLRRWLWAGGVDAVHAAGDDRDACGDCGFRAGLAACTERSDCAGHAGLAVRRNRVLVASVVLMGFGTP